MLFQFYVNIYILLVYIVLFYYSLIHLARLCLDSRQLHGCTCIWKYMVKSHRHLFVNRNAEKWPIIVYNSCPIFTKGASLENRDLKGTQFSMLPCTETVPYLCLYVSTRTCSIIKWMGIIITLQTYLFDNVLQHWGNNSFKGEVLHPMALKLM